MNHIKFTPANLEQIRPALERCGWHLVDAGDGWLENGKKMRTLYVLDENGDVLDHYWSLIDLARDLRVPGEREIVDACNLPLGVAGRASEAMEPAEGDAAEVDAIMALLGDSNPMAGAQVLKEDAGDHGLADEDGCKWVSWHHQAKVPYTW